METASQRLLKMGFGFAASQALAVAAELQIAELLQDGPRTAEDLAAASATDPRALYRLLRFLAAEGVFREERVGEFANTELSEAIRADAPASPRDFILMINREAYAAWGQLLHSVRTGEPAFRQVFGASRFEWLATHPEQGALFQRAMVSLSMGGNAEIANSYDFSACRRVVDVGGGHGQLLSAVVLANPHLTGVLLDLPTGIEAARNGVGGPLPRCELVVGDFFTSIPAADTYLIKKVIHDWGDEDAVKILTNCRRAMQPDGRVLVIETVVPAGNEPNPIKLMDLNMLVVTGGIERTTADYDRLFSASDLRLVQALPTNAPMSILEAVPSGLTHS